MAWTQVNGLADDGGTDWCNVITFSPKSSTFLGVSEAPENLLVLPEDMELEVEEIQNDDEGWTILPPPT